MPEPEPEPEPRNPHVVALLDHASLAGWNARRGAATDLRAAAAELERLESLPRVYVAVAVADDADRVLFLRRAGSASLAGSWCLPGGRLEPGESLEACCRRELREETGLDVGPLAFDGVTEVPGPPQFVGVVFRARRASGLPRVMEPDRHDGYGWFTPYCFPAPLTPGDRHWASGGIGGTGAASAELDRLRAALARYVVASPRPDCLPAYRFRAITPGGNRWFATEAEALACVATGRLDATGTAQPRREPGARAGDGLDQGEGSGHVTGTPGMARPARGGGGVDPLPVRWSEPLWEHPGDGPSAQSM